MILFDYVGARIKAKEAIESSKKNKKSEGEHVTSIEPVESIEMPPFIWEKFILPFVISFLLFGYFWGEYGEAEIGFLVICSSYQNGFFWQTTFEKLKSK